MNIKEIPVIKKIMIKIKAEQIRFKDRNKTIAEAMEEAESIINNQNNS